MRQNDQSQKWNELVLCLCFCCGSVGKIYLLFSSKLFVDLKFI